MRYYGNHGGSPKQRFAETQEPHVVQQRERVAQRTGGEQLLPQLGRASAVASGRVPSELPGAEWPRLHGELLHLLRRQSHFHAVSVQRKVGPSAQRAKEGDGGDFLRPGMGVCKVLGA